MRVFGRPLPRRIVPWLAATLFLLLFVIISLFPIYLMFVTSLKVPLELAKGVFSLPLHPQWQNYWNVFVVRHYYVNFLNSLLIAIPSTLAVMILGSFAGYAFGLYEFKGKRVLFMITLMGLMVGEVSILIPVYVMLLHIGLLNTRLGVIVPEISLGLPFSVFLATTFFRDVPRDILDAGIVDGCSDMGILRSIVLPLSGPALRTLAVIEFMVAWNRYLLPLVIATKYEVMPLSVALTDFMGRFTFNHELVATTTVIMLLPIMVLYIFMQKSFVRGITFGAVKG